MKLQPKKTHYTRRTYVEVKLRAERWAQELNAAFGTIRRLESELQTLAKLAADTPQFANPMHVWEAKRIRDRILESIKTCE